MELLILLLLILINGILSMSEIALVSARKTRLQFLARKGNKRAGRALELAGKPEKFLSAIQIGITLVGIFMGVYSGENITGDLQSFLGKMSLLEPYSHLLALILVVLLVTFLSLVLGELVPKQIGLAIPEKIAGMVARPIHIFSAAVRPFLWILNISAKLVIHVLGIRPSDEGKITEEEIKSIVEEGTKQGEVQEVEKDIVDRVFILGDTNVKSLMTHKSDIIWLDLNASPEEIRQKVSSNLHNIYPVAEKNLDHISGIVSLKDLFTQLSDQDFNLKKVLQEPNYLPETTTAYDAIRQFRVMKVFYALVIDEYGELEGMISVNDILESLVGEVSPEEEEYQITQRDDGSWLVDGQYPFHEFLNHFDLQELYEDHHYNTLSGLILDKLGYIPKAGEKLNWMNFDIEIVDMDRARIDKILVRQMR